jgi:hypothetical protein
MDYLLLYMEQVPKDGPVHRCMGNNFRPDHGAPFGFDPPLNLVNEILGFLRFE